MTRRGLLCAGVIAAALIGQLLFWRGGILEFEATAFIPQYLAERPMLAKVFDPHLNDFDAYQARELSYVVDYADAVFHVLVLRTTDYSLFIALSSMLATAAIAIVVTLGAARLMANVSAGIAAAALAVFFSSFQYASTAGIYYRSSKMMLAAVLIVLLFRLRAIARERRRGDAALIGALCVAAGALDRQGFFLVVVLALMLVFHAWRTGQLRDVAVAALGAVAILVLYNAAIAPALIYTLNGYWPDFSYQARSIRSVALLWQPHYFVRAVRLLAANTGVMFGGAALALAGLGALVLMSSRSVQLRSRALHYAALGALAHVVMFAMMIHQHPPIEEYVDHRFWYYTMPFAAVSLFALLAWLDALALSAVRQRIVLAALCVAAIANLMSLPGRRSVMANGPYFGRVFAQSELLKRSLAAGVPDPGLDAVYRQYYDDEQRLRH